MTKDEIIKTLRDMAKYPTVTLPRDCEALRMAADLLAQPEQEPVAWMYPDDYERMTTSETFCTVYSVEVGSPTRGESTVALYTTPPQRTWVGLTEKDILEAAVKSQEGISPRNDTLRFATAIEAKLKEKNNGN